MGFFYVLRSELDYSLYFGSTDNLKRRFKEHNEGRSKYTKNKRPWKLIYYEACLNKEDAKRREKYFKKTQGRRLLKRRLKEYFYSKSNK